MAPTIQTKTSEYKRRESGGSTRHSEKKSDLLVNVKYTNNLPDVPFDPKYLKLPFNSKRFVEYAPTFLEQNYKFDLITTPDLGVLIDLIDPNTYKVGNKPLTMDPADEYLFLEDDLSSTTQIHKCTSGSNLSRAAKHAKAVPWLRRTEYISTEFNRFTSTSSDKAESRIQKLMKKDEEDLYKDRDSQIAAISSTFEAVRKKATKHYSKPNVYAVEEMPIFPDFGLWRHPCAQVLFDSDPFVKMASVLPQQQTTNTDPLQKQPPNPSQQTKDNICSQAMIRGMMDESGHQFVAYFLPTDKTMSKFERDMENDMAFEPEDVYYYQMAREYNWNVKNKSSKGYEENYFLIFRPTESSNFGCISSEESPLKTTNNINQKYNVPKVIAFYNELETRVRLNKRRLLYGQQNQVNRTKLAVRYRPFNNSELELQDNRVSQIVLATEMIQEQLQEKDEKIQNDHDINLNNEELMQSEGQTYSQSDNQQKTFQLENDSDNEPPDMSPSSQVSGKSENSDYDEDNVNSAKNNPNIDQNIIDKEDIFGTSDED